MPESLKTIFLITAVCSVPGRNSRCWGGYPTKEDAWIDLVANTDMFCESGSFDYIVIEECGPGIMALVDAPSPPIWVRAFYNPANHKYDLLAVSQPEFANGIICWGMG